MARSERWPAAVLTGLSVVWVLLSCAPALAHARLEKADPPEGANLNEAPEQVRLRFNEPVEAEFDPIEVYDAQGDRVDQDDGRLEAPEVVVVGLEKLTGGSYRVEWRVTSADGDPVGDSYRFTVEDSAAQDGAGNAPAPSGGEQEAGSSGASTVALYVGLGVVALALLGFAVLRRR